LTEAADQNPTPIGRRRRIVIAILAALALIAVVIAVVLANRDADNARPAATPTQGSSEAPSTDADTDTGATDDGQSDSEAEEQAVATTAITAFLDAIVSPADPTDAATSSELAAVADGVILEELQAESLEFDTNEWVRTGAPAVVWTKVVESDSAAGTMTVEACLDSSGVVVTDASGNALPATTTPRAINIYTLHQGDRGWVVTARTFPDNPSC
jgi:hypothetical protein